MSYAEPLEQHSLPQDANPVFMTTPQPSQGQLSPVYTAGFHQCMSNVTHFVTMTSTCSSEVDPELNNLRVCLDSHFSSSGGQSHRKGRLVPMSDGTTPGSHHGPLPASEQLTPPHSPSLSCSSPNNSSSSSSPSPSPHPLALPYDQSLSHSASLYSLDSRQLSLSSSSSSPAMALSSMSHLPMVQSPTATRTQAAGSPIRSTTWRPWN
ncbi:hypothetical protein ACEWY4_026653 [Coilia grayii]|uniref:Uncharacterized protein n=1 Tax=Coilia grayii TaxID=363190 RepID=A0ABD1IQP7_9TELE